MNLFTPSCKIIQFCALALLGVIGSYFPLTARTFTNSQGQSLEATLIDADANNAMLRRLSDRKEFPVPIKSLSESDRNYIEEWKRFVQGSNNHPLGWKRLRIVTDDRSTSISVPGMEDAVKTLSPTEKILEIPVGTWVRVRFHLFGDLNFIPAFLLQYQGEPEWHLTWEEPWLYLSKTRGEKGEIVGVSLQNDEYNYRVVPKIMRKIENRDIAIYSTSGDWKDFSHRIRDVKCSLCVADRMSDFERLDGNSSVRAISIYSGTNTVDFFPKFPALEALDIDFSVKADTLSGLNSLRSLKALEMTTPGN